VFNDIVPASANLTGDFSGAKQAVIYDPLTTRPAATGSGVIRDPFPGNLVAANRLSPQALFSDKTCRRRISAEPAPPSRPPAPSESIS